MGSFLVFALALGTAVFVAGIRRGDRWYQMVGPPLFALALVVAPMNGSRSVVFGFFLAVPFVLYEAFQQGRRSALILGISALLLVGGYVGTQSQWATQGWAAFGHRVETASDQDARIKAMLLDPIKKVDILFGYGAGSTHPGANALSSEGRVHPAGVNYEPELGRAIVELGLIGGVLFIALKLWVLWMTWDAMRRARTSWEDVLCMTAFIVAFLHLIVEKIVFNHIGGSIYWLCAGAALWVWCRRDSVPTDVDSSRLASSSP
jgi:O-antigen ligase